jgi:hypothetical protein
VAQQVADVAPFVSNARSDGRCSATGSSRASSPASTSCITWAAATAMVMLAIENWSLTVTSRTPSPVPVAPLHVPWADMTVADTPASPAASRRVDCSSAARWAASGSMPMAANASVGNPASVGLGLADRLGSGVGGWLAVARGVVAIEGGEAVVHPTTRSARIP